MESDDDDFSVLNSRRKNAHGTPLENEDDCKASMLNGHLSTVCSTFLQRSTATQGQRVFSVTMARRRERTASALLERGEWRTRGEPGHPERSDGFLLVQAGGEGGKSGLHA